MIWESAKEMAYRFDVRVHHIWQLGREGKIKRRNAHRPYEYSTDHEIKCKRRKWLSKEVKAAIAAAKGPASMVAKRFGVTHCWVNRIRQGNAYKHSPTTTHPQT